VPVEIGEFHQEFFQDVIASADAGGQYVEDAFFERFCEHLIDAGELETADRVQFVSPRGLRVDGYGGDPLSAEGVLSLIVADFSQSPEVATLTATEMDAIFKRLSNFLTRALDDGFRDSLEETSPAFGLADLMAQRWPDIVKVRLFLISNRVLSARVDGRAAGEIDGIPTSYSVWDLGRLHRFAASGTGREEVLIDLERDFGGALLALPAHLSEAGYQAYVLVIPGSQLAAIYDRWGARLLEQNVRVFLQARGNVNKGIRNTIENDPEMFLAYNNGVTATAEAVETRHDRRGLVLTSLRNFQIVNGGQTTASIHAASRKKGVDISKVFVQMKLSIVEPAQAIDIVPKISEYANSQNRVSAADFFSNHPFHVRFEEFSRRIFAPSPDGTFRESKWFYERARGQYQDARGLLSDAQRRRFDLEYPKSQVVSKTDLAKVLSSWRGHPEIVSRGSQKNFAEFAREIGREWTENSDTFNEDFYRHSIAKAITFRETERLVSEQPWYQGGGVRSRVVPYAIAKLAHDAKLLGWYVDFDRIWRIQTLPTELKSALAVVSLAVNDVIVDAGPENPNPLEWAKQPACWTRVKALEVQWPTGWTATLITGEQQAAGGRAAVRDQKVLNGIEAQTAVVKAGGNFWREVHEWGLAKDLLTPTEASILKVAASIPARLPSEKQSLRTLETLRKLHGEGFQDGKDVG
jgi:AIPR protein/Abortive infection phage resistance protein N-terminal domain